MSAEAAISVFPGTAQSLTGNGSLSPVVPAGVFSGDLLIAQVAAQSGATITAPTGWTQVVSASTNVNGVQQRIYYLNLSAAPAASYTWTLSSNGGNRAAAVIYGVRGAQAADCGAAATAICAGALQASNGGNQVTAPNVQSQPPTYAAGSLRMAFFTADYGTETWSLGLQNSASAGTSLSTGGTTSGVSINGSYYLMASASNGDQQTAGLSTSASNIGATFIITASSSFSLTCLGDTFNRTSGLGGDWATAKLSGSFTPSIVGNRLRLTDTGTNESTAVSFQRLFPGANNYVQLMFKYYGYGGSGADGIAVILSDAAVTPQPGGFGGSLGYAPKASAGAAGFAGGWLGLGLDEYGNFSNRNDSGACAPGVASCATSGVPQSVSIRGSASNYYWLRGTGTLGTSVSNSTGHLYRVTVDSRVAGQALVSVERDSTGAGTAFSTLINSFNIAAASGQAAVPANLILSLTGSSGDSTNNHEVDDLQICAQSLSTISAIDHYEFTANTGLTCTPNSVTVRACMDAACTTTYSGNVNVTLTPAGAWVGGDTKTFPGSGGTFSLSETTAGSYTVGVVANSSTPALKAFTTNAALCKIDGASTATTACSVPFKDSGFLITVPTQTSGKTSNSADGTLASIAAVKKSDDSLACTPAFAGVTRSLKLWSSYSNPNTGSRTLAVNGTTIGTSSATATSVSLAFDSTGTASGIALNYADAGQISLNASYTGSAANSDAGLSMTGSSTPFVEVPYALCVDSPDSGWNCTATQANAQTPTNCSVFKVAGDSFNLRVTGKAYSSSTSAICAMPTTPNYVQSDIPITSTVFAPQNMNDGGVTLTPHNATNPASIDIPSAGAAGTATVTATETDVGVFTLSAVPKDKTYFGMTVPSGSAVFGRFIPKGFKVESTLTNRSDLAACSTSTFTYLSEPLTAGVTLSAVNSSGAVTSNYAGLFARMNVATVASAGSNGLAFGAQRGTTLLNSRLSTTISSTCPTCSVAFNNGISRMNAALTVKRGSTVDGPFNNTVFGLVATDADGVGVYNPNFSWDLAGANDGWSLGATNLLFGRMRLDNAYGSPLLALPVRAEAQFWNGTAFQLNADDRCTPIPVPTAVPIATTNQATIYCNGGIGLYGTLSGVTASMNGTAAGGTSVLKEGDAKLVLGRPAGNSSGFLDIALSVPDYLMFNWDGVDQNLPMCTSPGDGDMFDDNPRARIRFGIRRNDKIIYLREVY